MPVTRPGLPADFDANGEQVTALRLLDIAGDAAEAMANEAMGSGSDLTYVHTQGVSATTWNVTHNLGKYPAVTVIDSGGTEFEAEITHTSTNALTVSLALAVTGTATCN